MRFFTHPSKKTLQWLRISLHVAALMPLVLLVMGESTTRAVLWATGNWSLYFLCITLAITPLRRLTGCDWLNRFRRLPGMYAFFYGLLHLGT